MEEYHDISIAPSDFSSDNEDWAEQIREEERHGRYRVPNATTTEQSLQHIWRRWEQSVRAIAISLAC
jgi:hypothetical protein